MVTAEERQNHPSASQRRAFKGYRRCWHHHNGPRVTRLPPFATPLHYASSTTPTPLYTHTTFNNNSTSAPQQPQRTRPEPSSYLLKDICVAVPLSATAAFRGGWRRRRKMSESDMRTFSRQYYLWTIVGSRIRSSTSASQFRLPTSR